MVWRYTSSVLVDKSKVLSLWQYWRVWSNIPIMPQWDKDCLSARLDSDLNEGEILFITMRNKPKEENACVLTQVRRPDQSSPTRTSFHFLFSIPLADLSFQYEAEEVDGTNQVKVTHSTVITGFLSSVYGLALGGVIREGCDHMSANVPALAETMSAEPE